jgi:general secretion pathway protein G
MKKGFTLIELMIVILIIGILAGITIGVINSSGVRSKARDAQRIADVKKLQTALELYFTDNRSYPQKTSWTAVSGLAGTLVPSYINTLPTDPSSGTTVLSANRCFGQATYGYYYLSDNDGSGGATKYVLGTIVEVTSSNNGNSCTDVANCSSLACSCGSSSFCYVTQNPL